MTQGINTQKNTVAYKPSFKDRLLQCAAASAAAWAMTSTPAHAAIPPECDVQVNPNIIDCVVAAPGTLEPVEITQDNTTIIIGDDNIPTTLVAAAGNAVELNGNGAQTVIVNDGSIINALNGGGISLTGEGLLSVFTGENSLASANGVGIGDGITVIADGAININALGNVTGFSDAIIARNDGAGAITVTTAGQVTSLNNIGIAAVNSVNGTNLTIDTSGDAVSAPNAAIRGVNNGSGVLSITTADLTSLIGGNVGISAENEGTDAIIDTTAGSINATRRGIVIENTGSGDTTVLTADINAGLRDGITVRTADTTDVVLVDSQAGSINAGEIGIRIEHLGRNTIRVITGDVTGGIDGINIMGEGDSIVVNTVAGTVTGGVTGINVDSDGDGALLITTADVVGIGDNAITASSSAVGEGAIIDTSAGSLLANGAGIFANNNNGSVAITAADISTTIGSGIFVNNSVSSSNILVDTVAGSVSAGNDGIFATNNGTGFLFIRTGEVNSQNNFGIFASNDGTSLTIDSTQGAVSGNDGGILAFNFNSGALTIQTTDVSSATGRSIDAMNNGSELAIDSTAGTVTAATIGIRALQNGTAAVSVTTADVNVANGDGIAVTNMNGGQTFVDTSAGTVDVGATGLIITNASNGSATTIITADVNAAQNNGIFAQALVGTSDIEIDTTNGTIVAGQIGIDAVNEGTGTLTITTAGVTGTNGFGIMATNGAASQDLTIDSSMGAVLGGFSGIIAQNEGTGRLSVTTADITGEMSSALIAVNGLNGTALEVDTSAGIVSGGIMTINAGSDELTVITADVLMAGNVGISAENGGTNLTIVSSAGTIDAANTGIAVNNVGSGRVTITTADVTGTTENGIVAGNQGSGLLIDSSTGTVIGGMNGIFAMNEGTAELSVTTADVMGSDGFGIMAENNGTFLTIDTSAGSVIGSEIGIQALNNGMGELSIKTADVTSTNSVAIMAENNGSMLDIDTSAGNVLANDIGILANNNNGSLTITTADVTATQGSAIVADNFAGATDLSIDTSAGTVMSDFVAINAENVGSGALSVTTADVTSTNSVGILAQNGTTGTDLTVNSSAGSVTANFNAIVANNEGTGSLLVTTGDVTSGSGDGVRAEGGAMSGNIAIDTSAGSLMAGDDGIFARQESVGTLSITTGNVFAANNGVVLQATGGQSTITNQGTIIGANSFEILVTGASMGNVAVNNNGTIIGNVRLADGDDVVTNNGTFDVIGDSGFGLGNDVFTNNGRVNVSGTVGFTGLEQFTNTGSVSMLDGATDDSLALAGDYVGNGGTLGLDVSFNAAPSADLLTVGGAATGNSLIVLDSLDPLQSFGNTLTLVDAGAGSNADAFALAGSNVQQLGFLNVSLRFDAEGNDFLLDSAINSSVFQAAKFAEGAQSLWYRSADAWATHVDSKRHADKGQASPLWLQFYGAISDRDENFDFTSGGFTQNIALDYSQDYFGLQGGVEFGPGNAGEGVFYGLTTGYTDSNLGFDGTADRVSYDAFNLGAYVGYVKDGFFANALAKYDFIDADINGATAGYAASIKGDAYGLRSEAGYRWISQGGFFVEPAVSVEYQMTSLDNFDALGTSFDFDSFDGLRGTAGVRLGGESEIKSGNKLTYYASGRVAHEFEGEGNVIFSLPAASTTISNNAIDTYGHFDLGLNISTKGGVTGFIEGNADVSSNYTSFGGRVGIRIKF